MKILVIILTAFILYLVGYYIVRIKYDNGNPIGGLGGNFPGLSFWHGGKFDTILFYLYFPVIVIDGKVTGINYLYAGDGCQIIQWNTMR